MRKSICLMAATGLLAVGALTACGEEETPGGTTTKPPKVGVILPDSGSSSRWETADRRFLSEVETLAAEDPDPE